MSDDCVGLARTILAEKERYRLALESIAEISADSWICGIAREALKREIAMTPEQLTATTEAERLDRVNVELREALRRIGRTWLERLAWRLNVELRESLRQIAEDDVSPATMRNIAQAALKGEE